MPQHGLSGLLRLKKLSDESPWLSLRPKAFFQSVLAAGSTDETPGEVQRGVVLDLFNERADADLHRRFGPVLECGDPAGNVRPTVPRVRIGSVVALVCGGDVHEKAGVVFRAAGGGGEAGPLSCEAVVAAALDLLHTADTILAAAPASLTGAPPVTSTGLTPQEVTALVKRSFSAAVDGGAGLQQHQALALFEGCVQELVQSAVSLAAGGALTPRTPPSAAPRTPAAPPSTSAPSTSAPSSSAPSQPRSSTGRSPRPAEQRREGRPGPGGDSGSADGAAPAGSAQRQHSKSGKATPAERRASLMSMTMGGVARGGAGAGGARAGPVGDRSLQSSFDEFQSFLDQRADRGPRSLARGGEKGEAGRASYGEASTASSSASTEDSRKEEHEHEARKDAHKKRKQRGKSSSIFDVLHDLESTLQIDLHSWGEKLLQPEQEAQPSPSPADSHRIQQTKSSSSAKNPASGTSHVRSNSHSSASARHPSSSAKQQAVTRYPFSPPARQSSQAAPLQSSVGDELDVPQAALSPARPRPVTAAASDPAADPSPAEEPRSRKWTDADGSFDFSQYIQTVQPAAEWEERPVSKPWSVTPTPVASPATDARLDHGGAVSSGAGAGASTDPVGAEESRGAETAGPPPEPGPGVDPTVMSIAAAGAAALPQGYSQIVDQLVGDQGPIADVAGAVALPQIVDKLVGGSLPRVGGAKASRGADEEAERAAAADPMDPTEGECGEPRRPSTSTAAGSGDLIDWLIEFPQRPSEYQRGTEAEEADAVRPHHVGSPVEDAESPAWGLGASGALGSPVSPRGSADTHGAHKKHSTGFILHVVLLAAACLSGEAALFFAIEEMTGLRVSVTFVILACVNLVVGLCVRYAAPLFKLAFKRHWGNHERSEDDYYDVINRY